MAGVAPIEPEPAAGKRFYRDVLGLPLADVSGDSGLVERLSEQYLRFTFRALGITAPVVALP